MAPLNTSRLNETFDLLTHPHRRYVLYHLRTKARDVGIETLAATIADWNEAYSGMERASRLDKIKRRCITPTSRNLWRSTSLRLT